MMKTKRTLSLLMLLLAAVLLLTACGNKDTMQVQQEEPEPEITEEVTDRITGGAIMEEAVPIPLEKKLYGKVSGDEVQWFSFTTTDKENCTYCVTAVHKTPKAADLYVGLYDQSGQILSDGRCTAENNGQAKTASNRLDPNTTYYLSVKSGDTVEFMLMVCDPDDPASRNLLGCGKENATDEAQVVGSTDQESATALQLETRVYGTARDRQRAWYAFRTTGKENCTYNVVAVHKTPKAADLYVTLFDQYGQMLSDGRCTAENSGLAKAASNRLEPDTTYYLSVYSDDTVDYMLLVTDPGDPDHRNLLGFSRSSAPEETEVRGGTSQDDSVLLPLNTKRYGTARDGQRQWYAFTTTEKENCTYSVTAVHKTVKASDLYVTLFDQYGQMLSDGRCTAENDGFAETAKNRLDPNTTYYISVSASDTVDYMLAVRDPEEELTAYRTAGSLNQAIGTADFDANSVTPATNQDDAPMVPIDVPIKGKTHDKLYDFYAFRTGSAENVRYQLGVTHETPNAQELYVSVVNEYGTKVDGCSPEWNDGKPEVRNIDLKPNTLYTIAVYSSDVVQYTLFAEPEGGVEPTEEPSAEQPAAQELILETPFELDETQVAFVADEATYLNPKAAKTALQPLAERILAYPDNKVLLAGTTAKVSGDQTSSAALSEQRAQAVKKTLMEFGVPEEQLIVLGLGFENDPFPRGQEWTSDNRFVETEAARNRRVVVLDAADPIAQGLIQKLAPQG